MFDRTFLPATQTHAPQSAAADPFEEALIAVQAVREAALQQAHSLVQDFINKRTEAQMAGGGEFIGIALYVRERSEGRSISLEWSLGHFRNGKYTGSTALKKRRGSTDYDGALLKRNAPKWAHDLVLETENEARRIRDALKRLTEADTALKVATRRLCANAGPDTAPPTEDADA